jgi:hypothetical protein
MLYSKTDIQLILDKIRLLTLLARTSPRYQRNRFAWWILQSVLPARMSGFSNQCNSFPSPHGLVLGSPLKGR